MAAEFHLHPASDLFHQRPHQLLGQIHEIPVVAVGLIELQTW